MSAQFMQSLAQKFREASAKNEKFTLPMMTAGQWVQFQVLLTD